MSVFDVGYIGVECKIVSLATYQFFYDSRLE